MSALDVQIGGNHYKRLGIQPVPFWQANMMGASEGACIKYATRWKDKEGVKDLRKGRHFIELILEDETYIAQCQLLRSVLTPHMRNRLFNVMGPTEYIQANNLCREEAGVVRHIWWWNFKADPAELRSALAWMNDLIVLANGEA